MSHLTAPLLTLALFGCAANRHLHAGDDFAASGDWAGALREYQHAEARRPHSDEIAGLVDEARVKAVADYLDAAGSALQGDDLRAAHDALDEARRLRPDLEEIEILEDRLVGIGLMRVNDLHAANQTDDAYRLAVRLHGWYRTRDDVARVVRDQRAIVRGEASSLADRGRFRDALARLDVIGDQEPRFESLETWRAELRTRWADELIDLAHAFETRGEAGSAYVAAAAAAGLVGRADDAMLRDRLRGALVADYGLTIDLDVTGDVGGRAAIERAIDARVASPAVTVGNFVNPDLAVDVSLSPTHFDESVTTTLGEQPYVSGWDEVPNPAYRDQRAAVDRVEGYVADRELELRLAREALGAARHADETDRAALVPLQAAADVATSSRTGAEDVERHARAALEAAGRFETRRRLRAPSLLHLDAARAGTRPRTGAPDQRCA